MKNFKKIASMVLVVALVSGGSINCFASAPPVNGNEGNHLEATATSSEFSSVIVTDDGVHINGTFYTQEDFMNLLENAEEVPAPSTRMVGVVAGTWFIPGIGQVIVTAAGVVIIGGAVVAAGSWLYKQVVSWFSTQQEIKDAQSKIPSRLKDSNGVVDLGKFKQDVKGKTAYKEPGGWIIDKDTSGHKKSKWKLKNKQGKKVASLDKNGKVLGK